MVEKIISQNSPEDNRTLVLEDHSKVWKGQVNNENGDYWYVQVTNVSRLIDKYSQRKL